MILDDDVDNLLLLHLVDKFEKGPKRKRCGSMVDRPCIPHDRVLGDKMPMKDYFTKVSTYSAHLFHRLYRMRSSLFVRIVEACEQNCHFFTRRRNDAILVGFSAYQKISTVMRVITYGVSADYADEYLRIGEDTPIKCIQVFSKTMTRFFWLMSSKRGRHKEAHGDEQRKGMTEHAR